MQNAFVPWSKLCLRSWRRPRRRCLWFPAAPLSRPRRPELQAGPAIKLLNACQALIQYATALLFSFLQGKEAGFFNKVIAPLLYFPFINYKEMKAE